MSNLSSQDRESSIRELRRLLFESELQSLHSVQQAVADPGQRRVRIEHDLSKLLNSLSPAELRTLAQELRPVTQQTLALVAQEAPDELGRILAPSLGPFIRSYVRVLVSSTVDGLAKLLENALTLKSLRWRWEAWTTGRSFGEVALYHSLLYRVRRVLLIHEPTGTLLCAAAIEASEVGDDLVSGMLSAFRSFMRSSMDENDAHTVNLIQSGPHSFLVHQSGDLLLGAQIDGVIRPSLSEHLVETLEALDRRFRDEVADFKGDTRPFEAARPRLETCLVFEAKRTGGRTWTRWLAAGLLVTFLLVLAAGVGFRIHRGMVFQDYVEALRAEPGLVVTSYATGWLQPTLTGMNDPLAPDPAGIWQQSGAARRWLGRPPEERWTPVLLATPSLVERRLQSAFEASEELEVSVAGRVGSLRGRVAPRDEIRQRWLHPAWFGLDAIDEGELGARTEALRALFEQVRGLMVPFPLGESTPADADVLDEARLLFGRIDAAMDRPLRIEVVGRADPSGPAVLNRRLRFERALWVREALGTREWEHLRFVATSESADRASASEPSVVFEVSAP